MKRITGSFNIDFITESKLDNKSFSDKVEKALSDALNQVLEEEKVESWDMHPGLMDDMDITASSDVDELVQ